MWKQAAGLTLSCSSLKREASVKDVQPRRLASFFVFFFAFLRLPKQYSSDFRASLIIPRSFLLSYFKCFIISSVVGWLVLFSKQPFLFYLRLHFSSESVFISIHSEINFVSFFIIEIITRMSNWREISSKPNYSLLQDTSEISH